MPDEAPRERIGAVVQARMSSSRLPGKVLRELGGRPVLAWLLDGLTRAPGLVAITVSTSTEPDDDAVADFCAAREGVALHRGPLDDVAGRMLAAAEAERLDALVRVNGDSPLLDPELVSAGVELFRQSGADLVSNVYPQRSFPVGESVEVVRTSALAEAHARMGSDEDREHVTPLIYREPERFAIVGFAADEDCSSESLAVDDAADLALLEGVIAGLDRDPWEHGWRELLARKQAL